MKKLNKIISGALAALMIFTSVPVYAVNDISTERNTEISTETEENTSEIISDGTGETSSSPETEVTEIQNIEDRPTVFLDDEDDLEETDNWELSVVFYDSSVENGKKPLTEINWDASDGGHSEGTPRIITVQVNYKNTNAVTTYQPGDVVIQLNNLLFSDDYSSDYYNEGYIAYSNEKAWRVNVETSLNDYTNTGREWTLTLPSEYKITTFCESEYFTITNSNIIEEKSNFEGSFQIIYKIRPMEESRYGTAIERYEDTCTHTSSSIVKATLNDIQSNEISFNYNRVYTHVWEKQKLTLDQTPNKITSYDGLGSNPSEYIWVNYKFKINRNSDDEYFPYVKIVKYTIKDSFPEGCKVIDGDTGETLQSNNGEYLINYIMPSSYYDEHSKNIYVGYPKSIFNEENNNLLITNYAELYTDFEDGTKDYYHDNSEVSLNLADFVFSYSGDLYSISKSTYNDENCSSNSSYYLYYQNLVGSDTDLGNNGNISWITKFNTKYTGTPINVRIGDDLLYITGSDGNYRKLNDNEYYFSKIYFPRLYNGLKVELVEEYDVDLYVRYANSNNYTLYSSFKNNKNTITFTEKNIVGFYFEIKNVTSELMMIDTNTEFNSDFYYYTIINKARNIAKTGSVYNFNYLSVYDLEGNLLNQPDITSYDSLITKEEIANYDLSTYGHYLQRATCEKKYNYYENPELNPGASITKTLRFTKNNYENEMFEGRVDVMTKFYDTYIKEYNPGDYIKYAPLKLPKDKGFTGFEYYDLLPEGMILTSSKEEILNSITSDTRYARSLYNINKKRLTRSEQEKIFREHASVEIIENWNGTKRTWIHIKIDLNDYPLYYLAVSRYKDYLHNSLIDFSYNYVVSYDSYLEYGPQWKNNLYASYYGDNKFERGLTIIDNGNKDSDELDINNNGDTTEKLMFDSDSITFTNPTSSHQDLQIQTLSTLSNYSTGTVPAEYGKDYSYKLRVRTGQNDVTNLIIYDNLEKWTKDKNGNFIKSAGSKEYWQGEFQGIDTSYAESKGYNVKVWYSENEKAGTLAEDSSWKEYIGPTLITDSEKTVTITSPNWPNNYPANMTETNNYWEQSFDGAESIQITFDSASELENAKYDYLCFYDREGNNITNDIFEITAGKIGGSDLAGKTVIVPGDYVKITMRTDGSSQYKGFSAQLAPMYTINRTDNTKVKSLAFQYFDAEGNPAVLPENSLTYVEINMKAPADEDITTLAYNGCWTQWNAIDEFGQPVDFITGINSNIVKVALPNSIDEDSSPSIQLNIEKEIQGTTEAFENMQLDPNGEYQFKISLVKQEENEDDSHDVINGVISNKKGIIIKDLSYGTWLIKETDDTYFDLVEIISMDDPEITTPGVTFEKTDAGYMLTIDENIDSATEYSLKIINEIEPERFYEDKDSEVNIFKEALLVEK